MKSRSGLFPQARSSAHNNRPKRYSFVDACVLRAVVALRSSGLPATDAVRIAATAAHPYFETFIDADDRGADDFEDHLPILCIRVAGDEADDPSNRYSVQPVAESDQIASIMANSEAVTLLDMRAVIRFATRRLAVLHPDVAAALAASLACTRGTECRP